MTHSELLSFWMLLSPTFLSAQPNWVVSGNSIYPPTGVTNVGIGTTSPTDALDIGGGGLFKMHGGTFSAIYRETAGGLSIGANVSGAGNDLHLVAGAQSAMNILGSNGNVGIGTTLPTQRFENAGSRTAFGPDGTGNHWFTTNTGTSEPNNVAMGFSASNGTVQSISLVTAGSWRMYIGNNGNVGIGTTAPQHLLQVAGTIGAQEVLVTPSGADYVFEPGYRLRSLGEVANYIQANHHLPDIPSAEEVKRKGVGVGEMETKLLTQIEELTLHMIQAEQRNLELQQRITRLETGAGDVRAKRVARKRNR